MAFIYFTFNGGLTFSLKPKLLFAGKYDNFLCHILYCVQVLRFFRIYKLSDLVFKFPIQVCQKIAQYCKSSKII